MTRNTSIEGLRGLLMMWIVLFHYTCRYNSTGIGHEIFYPISFPSGGVWGVMLFFVISGYFTGGCIDGQGGVKYCVKFFVNRYWRLWPTYAISCIIIYIWLWLMPIPGHHHITMSELTINTILIVHPFVNFIDGAHWFIKTLVEAYCILALIIIIQNKKKRDCLLIFTVAITILIKYCNDYLPTFIQGETIQFGNSYMALMLGYYIYKWKAGLIPKVMTILLLGLYLLSSPIYLLLITLFVFLLNFGDNKCAKKTIGSNLFSIFGGYCYHWYLIHQNIGYSIQYHLLPHGHINIMWLLIPMTITYLIAVVIAKVTIFLPPPK